METWEHSHHHPEELPEKGGNVQVVSQDHLHCPGLVLLTQEIWRICVQGEKRRDDHTNYPSIYAEHGTHLAVKGISCAAACNIFHISRLVNYLRSIPQVLSGAAGVSHRRL
jgi:hypothetical protein